MNRILGVDFPEAFRNIKLINPNIDNPRQDKEKHTKNKTCYGIFFGKRAKKRSTPGIIFCCFAHLLY